MDIYICIYTTSQQFGCTSSFHQFSFHFNVFLYWFPLKRGKKLQYFEFILNLSGQEGKHWLTDMVEHFHTNTWMHSVAVKGSFPVRVPLPAGIKYYEVLWSTNKGNIFFYLLNATILLLCEHTHFISIKCVMLCTCSWLHGSILIVIMWNYNDNDHFIGS